MGRHAGSEDAAGPVGSTGVGTGGRFVLITAALITLVGAGVLIAPRQALADLPWASAAPCQAQTVELTVSPELTSVVTQILAPIRGQYLDRDTCLAIDVRPQEAQQTLASATVLPIDRAPQIWIPDGSVWGEKNQRWSLTSAGSLATTPVVVATSAEAREELGWAEETPSWVQALRGSRPVAVPDYDAQSESLDALIALWQSLGKGAAADTEVVATVLAADRGEVPSLDAAIADARSGTSKAPIFPSTEQAVAYLNATAQAPNLVAIYPREGSPILDYPILQVADSSATALEEAATRAVVSRLTSPAGAELMRRAGFRDPRDGSDSGAGNPVGTGINPRTVKVLAPPSREEVDGMITRIEALSNPSRILAVMDVSLSMKAELDDGLTRIQLVGAAARLGANQLPDSSSVGAWVFASKLDGNRDYRVLAPVRKLSSRDSEGESHRSYLMRLATGVNKYLSAGGTSLYDVTIAAIRQMHEDYDPKASNAIILMSDGGNQDSTGADLDEVLAEIRSLNSGKEKVAIFTAGLGPDADYAALRRIAEASGGYSYRIDTAGQGQQALLDGLRRNRKLGSG